MERVSLFVLICCVALSFNCNQDNSVNLPPEPTGQQRNIPWQSLAQSPWPMSSHDPQLTGRSPYKGPQLGQIQWSIDFPAGIFYSLAIGEDGTIYFNNVLNDTVYAVNDSGKIKWKYYAGGRNGSSPLIATDGTIYIGSADGSLHALNPDGTLKWKFTIGSLSSMHLVINIGLDGVIYITGDDGYLYAINPDGTLKWRYFGDNGFRGSMALSPDGHIIYIVGKVKSLYAVNRDGTMIWKFETTMRIVASPVVDSDGNIYFRPDDTVKGVLYSVKPSKEVRWAYQYSTGENINIFSSPTIDYDGNIYFTNKDTLFSLNYFGKLNWKFVIPELGIYEPITQPLICDKDGTIYFGSTWGKALYAVSKEGMLLWQISLNKGEVDGSPAIGADGTLYLGTHGTWLPPDMLSNKLYSVK